MLLRCARVPSPYSSRPTTRSVAPCATCAGTNATTDPSRPTSTTAMRVDASDETSQRVIVLRVRPIPRLPIAIEGRDRVLVPHHDPLVPAIHVEANARRE